MYVKRDRNIWKVNRIVSKIMEASCEADHTVTWVAIETKLRYFKLLLTADAMGRKT